MGPGGAVVRDDMGRITAKKVSGLEHEAVAGAWVSPPGVRQRSVQPRRERARSPNPAGSSASAMPAFQSLSPKVSRTAGSAIPSPSSVRVTRALSPSCSMVAATSRLLVVIGLTSATRRTKPRDRCA